MGFGIRKLSLLILFFLFLFPAISGTREFSSLGLLCVRPRPSDEDYLDLMFVLIQLTKKNQSRTQFIDDHK